MDAKAYKWFKLGALALPQGQSEFDFEIKGKQLRLDALFVTSDLAAEPREGLLWDRTPPATPQGLRADGVGKSHIELRWSPAEDIDVAHYNVYASQTPKFEIAQKRLIASPIEPQYTDWGLRQGTTYHYKVCAVDRRGNESQPSEEIAAQTAGKGAVVLVRQAVGDEREGLPPENSKSRKHLEQMGAFAVKAHRLTKDNPLAVTFDVPADGEYVVWAKYGLGRKEGSASVRIAMANERASLGWALRFIGSGHTSNRTYNASAFVWEQGQTGVGRYNRTTVFKLSKGQVKMTLSVASDSQLEVSEVVLTTDLGFQPKGIHCYCPGNPEWLEE